MRDKPTTTQDRAFGSIDTKKVKKWLSAAIKHITSADGRRVVEIEITLRGRAKPIANQIDKIVFRGGKWFFRQFPDIFDEDAPTGKPRYAALWVKLASVENLASCGLNQFESASGSLPLTDSFGKNGVGYFTAVSLVSGDLRADLFTAKRWRLFHKIPALEVLALGGGRYRVAGIRLLSGGHAIEIQQQWRRLDENTSLHCFGEMILNVTRSGSMP